MGLPTNFQIFSLIVSTTLMIFWIQRYKSPDKSWFFQTSGSAIMVGVARFWYYVIPFMALGWIVMGIGDFWALGGALDQTYTISVYWMFAGLAVMAFGIIYAFWQPNWLSPPWLRKLKREHGEIIDELVIDAVGMDKQVLRRRLETWESIEEWISEVEQKRNPNLRKSKLHKAGSVETDIVPLTSPSEKRTYRINHSGVDFQKADLRGADFSGADLRNANLKGADLRQADLREADLRGADLSQADLRGADLHLIDLRGADLRDAKIDVIVLDYLTGLDLSEVNLHYE